MASASGRAIASPIVFTLFTCSRSMMRSTASASKPRSVYNTMVPPMKMVLPSIHCAPPCIIGPMAIIVIEVGDAVTSAARSSGCSSSLP